MRRRVRAADRYAGNAYAKYETTNPVARRLMARFLGTVDAMVDRAAADGGGVRTIVDVGCGEGIVAERLAARTGAHVLGVDRDDPPRLAGEWARRPAVSHGGRLSFVRGDAHALALDDGSFDLACAIELLEQVADPERCVDELARVSREWMLLTVPREPVWRWLNLARGAYWSDRGDSPSTAQRFTRAEAVALASRAGKVVDVATPLPWTAVLVRLPSSSKPPPAP